MGRMRAGLAPAMLVVGTVWTTAAATPPKGPELPLAFEQNRGQGAGTAQFLARGAGYTIGVRPGGAFINVRAKDGKQSSVAMRLAGGSLTAHATPAGPLPGKVNYFIGSNRNKWLTDIPTWSRIEYPGVYRGIDLIYYGNQGRLEFDFAVQPGSDPSAIRLAFDGAAKPRTDSNGDLMIGELRQHKPVAYQVSNGHDRTYIECRYAVRANNEVAFELGKYDRARTLVIDPVLSYSTYLGGSVNEAVTSAKVDASGNLYIAGFTSSANFPARGGSQTAYGGTNSPILQGQFGDAFVAKLNPSGTAILYSTYLGGSGDDFATGIAIDASGNAYIAGNTQSNNFPTTAGVLQKTYKGFPPEDNNGFYTPGDGFVAKLNAAGNQLTYATYLGGSLNDLALGIAVDSNGNAVVVGATESSDFPTTANAIAPKFRGNANFGPSIAGDGFVAILNSSATALVYSTFLGGRSHDGASGVALDSQGNIYVCGVTFSGDFPTTPGAFQTTFKGLETSTDYNAYAGDAFVTKISPQGSLIYSTFLGGGFRDAATSIAVDGAGAVYVTGATMSSDFPATAGAAQPTYGGKGAAGTVGDAYGGDAFVAKLNPAGSALVYATYLGGKGDEAGTGIAVDAAGNAFVTGFTLSTAFPLTSDALQATNAGFGGQGLAPNASQGFPTERPRNTGDAFLVKLSPAGAIAYSSFFGGAQDDTGIGISVDAAGNPYVVGNTVSPALKTSSGAVQTTYGGFGPQWPRGDGFIAKFDFGGAAAGMPAKVNVIAGFVAAGAPGATLPVPFTVEVVDAQGAVVPNVSVAFSASGATANPVSAVTDTKGRASTTVTLGSTAGRGTVTATVAGAPAVSVDLSITAPVQGPVVQAFVNSASYQPAIAPGSWVTAYIDQTAPGAVTDSVVPVPTMLGGFRILVNGTPIPVYAVAPVAGGGTQLNALLPYETPTGSAQVVVEMNNVASAPFAVVVQPSAPGIFMFGTNRAVVQNLAPDGSVSVNTDTNPVPAGDYIIAYLTGQGALDHPIPSGDVALADPLSRPVLPYSATLGDTPVSVAFLGMTPGQLSLAQANIQVPRDMKPGTYPLAITIGTAKSNGPLVTVTNPRP